MDDGLAFVTVLFGVLIGVLITLGGQYYSGNHAVRLDNAYILDGLSDTQVDQIKATLQEQYPDNVYPKQVTKVTEKVVYIYCNGSGNCPPIPRGGS